MADQQDRDDLDRERPLADDETRGLGDDEFEDVDEEDEDQEDEDELNRDQRATGEVGSEGGSPGQRVVEQERRPTRGSEATETVERRRR